MSWVMGASKAIRKHARGFGLGKGAREEVDARMHDDDPWNRGETVFEDARVTEYNAVITSAAEGLGTQSMTEDLGMSSHVRVWRDCNAATAIVSSRESARSGTLN